MKGKKWYFTFSINPNIAICLPNCAFIFRNMYRRTQIENIKNERSDDHGDLELVIYLSIFCVGFYLTHLSGSTFVSLLFRSRCVPARGKSRLRCGVHFIMVMETIHFCLTFVFLFFSVKVRRLSFAMLSYYNICFKELFCCWCSVLVSVPYVITGIINVLYFRDLQPRVKCLFKKWGVGYASFLI